MKITALSITNFLAITSAEISLSDRGLVAIQGVNRADTSADSNGAGKSSIADALCWCLFGTTARGASGDEVINGTAKKGCVVSSTIVDGGYTYVISRHRKHKTGKNSLRLTVHDGLTEKDLTKGTDKLTQVDVDKIIGSSLEVFKGAIYAGQEEMPNLPALTDKALKMLVEEASGITLLEEAYKKSRETASAAATELAHTQSTHSLVLSQKASQEAQIKASEDLEKTWLEEHSERLDAAKNNVRESISVVRELSDQVDKFDEKGMRERIDLIDAKIAGVAQETEKLGQLERKVSGAAATMRLKNASLNEAKLAVARIETEIESVDGRIGTPCGECGRPITASEVAASRAALESKKVSADDKVSHLVRECAEARSAAAEALSERKTFEGKMTDISKETEARKKTQDLISEFEIVVAQRNAKIGEAKGLKAAFETIQAEKNPYTAQIETYKSDLARSEKEEMLAKQKVQEAEEIAAVEQEVVRVFSPSGVRARILDEVTPFLNAQTAKYLGTLSDGNITATWTTLVPAAKKGEFKEKFSIQVENATGGESFKRLSGGEKRKVRIATALALQDLVATRASKPIDLFIGDEIDDALDASGLERLMTILEEKAREKGTVFVISHNELSDHIRQTLTIEKTASGETKITEVAA